MLINLLQEALLCLLLLSPSPTSLSLLDISLHILSASQTSLITPYQTLHSKCPHELPLPLSLSQTTHFSLGFTESTNSILVFGTSPGAQLPSLSTTLSLPYGPPRRSFSFPISTWATSLAWQIPLRGPPHLTNSNNSCFLIQLASRPRLFFPHQQSASTNCQKLPTILSQLTAISPRRSPSLIQAA